MLLVVLGIFLALAIVCAVIDVRRRKEHYYDMLESGWTFLGSIFLVITLILLCVICFKAYDVIPEANIIDNKIAMYEEENARLEEQVAVTVNAYMQHESTTYEEILSENSINIALTLPELQSNEMVQQQIKIYMNNAEQIKTLKNQLIELSARRWRLYFGR